MNFFENMLAFDHERQQICKVKNINIQRSYDEKLDDDYGRVELSNGYVTFWKNFHKNECIILPWTGYMDKNKENVNLDDLLEDDKSIYRVTWNQNQTCWWLSPVKIKNLGEGDVLFEFGLNNQKLGNGYLRRDDLTKIGNYHTDGKRLELNTMEL